MRGSQIKPNTRYKVTMEFVLFKSNYQKCYYIYPTGRRDDQFQSYTKRKVADGSTLTYSCTSSSEWNRHPRMSFFMSPKMCKSQGEIFELYGGCWSVSHPILWSLSLTRLAVDKALSSIRMIPSDRIPWWFDFITRRSTLSHQGTNHTPLLFFACLHFQYWTNTLYTTLTSRAIKKQLYGPVRFHYACLLPYRWQYLYVRTVLQLLRGMCFMAGVRFLFDCRP